MPAITQHTGLKIMHHLTTTSFTLEGHRTVQTLGVVMGITVRSRSVFGLLGASLQTLVGYKESASKREIARQLAQTFQRSIAKYQPGV